MSWETLKYKEPVARRHYFKYHTWLEKRRFNLKTAAVIKPVRNYFTWSARRKKKTNKLR